MQPRIKNTCLFTAIAVFAALTLPVRLAAQKATEQTRKQLSGVHSAQHTWGNHEWSECDQRPGLGDGLRRHSGEHNRGRGMDRGQDDQAGASCPEGRTAPFPGRA